MLRMSHKNSSMENGLSEEKISKAKMFRGLFLVLAIFCGIFGSSVAASNSVLEFEFEGSG